MFLTDCQACGLRELRGPRSIELLVPADHKGAGVNLVYRCTRCATVNAVNTVKATGQRTAGTSAMSAPAVANAA